MRLSFSQNRSRVLSKPLLVCSRAGTQPWGEMLEASWLRCR